MELRVHKVVQAASGGSHVTIFEATVDLVPDGIEVEIQSVYPIDANVDDVALARQAIREGAEWVLKPLGLGASIRVQRIVVHPVDFKPGRFEMYTAKELTRLLGVAERLQD